MIKKINEAYQYISSKIDGFESNIGIILGTGLGALVNEINIKYEIEYSSIPNFPLSTVESHQGKLIFGAINGNNVIVMQGRFHSYEGYSMQEITFPIRVMHLFGIKTLLISNACGGMNTKLQKGDIVVITDHINLLGDNPLIGKNLDDFGPRFPDMSEPYCKVLIEKAEKISVALKHKIKKAVYVAVTGPNLETRAEYKFLLNIGADVVGMSTVPEVIVAKHQNMNVLALGVVTDECFPDTLEEANIQEIIATAMKTEPFLTKIMKEVVLSI